MVAEYLVFSPAIARVQGCMLVRSKDTFINLQSVCKTVRSLLAEYRRDQSQTTRISDVEREIFLYLLINTQLPGTEDIIKNDNFSSLAGTCIQINPLQFIELVNGLNLWEYMFECAPNLPESALTSLLPHVVKVIKGEEESEKLTGLWTAIGRSAALLTNNQQILKEYLVTVLRPKCSKREKIVNFLSLLCVLRSHLNPSPTQPPPLADLYNFESKLEATTKSTPKSGLDALLVALKAFVFDLDFDSWLDMAEASSDEVMKTNRISRVWIEDDIPSNLQLMAAHILAEVETSLQGMPGDLVVELVPVISQFSRRYTRQLELGIEELSLKQLITKIKEYSGDNKTPDWKLKAFIERVFSTFLSEALGEEESVATLNIFLPHLSNKLILLHETLSKQTNIQNFQKIFLHNVARISSLEDIQAVLKSSICNDTARFETTSFQDEFVSALNKATGGEEGSKEFLLLALQNREKTASNLVEEASRNPGQVKSISEILLVVQEVCLSVDADGSYLGNLLATNIQHKREREQDNVVDLFLKLGEHNHLLAEEVYRTILPQVFNLHTNNQFDECLVLLCLCSRIIDLPNLLAGLSGPLSRQSVVTISYILNLSYFKINQTSNDIRQESISLISKLLQHVPELELKPHLHPDILSYFLVLEDVVTLRDVVQNGFAKDELSLTMLAEMCVEETVAEILTFLPNLLNQEVIVLNQVLVKLAARKKADYEKPKLADLESVELLAICVQTLVSTSCINQVEKERLCLSFCGLLVKEMKDKETSALLNFIRIIVQTIWVIQGGSSSKNSDDAAIGSSISDEAAAVCCPAWSSFQAAVAQLLSQSPSEDDIRTVLLSLRLLHPSHQKDLVITMFNNQLQL